MTPREAQDLLDRGFLYTLSFLEEGLTARDVAVGALHYLLLQGAIEPILLPQVLFSVEDRLTRQSWVSFTLRLSARAPSGVLEMNLGRTVHFGSKPDGARVEAYEMLKTRHELAGGQSPIPAGGVYHTLATPAAHLPLPGGFADMLGEGGGPFLSRVTRDLLAL